MGWVMPHNLHTSAGTYLFPLITDSVWIDSASQFKLPKGNMPTRKDKKYARTFCTLQIYRKILKGINIFFFHLWKILLNCWRSKHTQNSSDRSRQFSEAILLWTDTLFSLSKVQHKWLAFISEASLIIRAQSHLIYLKCGKLLVRVCTCKDSRSETSRNSNTDKLFWLPSARDEYCLRFKWRGKLCPPFRPTQLYFCFFLICYWLSR